MVCTRLNSDGKVKSEKYTIYVGFVSFILLISTTAVTALANLPQLFESNAKPCHYMAGAKLTSPGRKPSFWRTECHPKRFWEAYGDFVGWFKNVTGREWDDRLDSAPHDPKKFRYAAPTLGRPVGALPPGKLPPGWGDDEDNGKGEGDGGLVYDTDSEVEDEGEDEDDGMERGQREVSIISISSGAPSETASGVDLPLR